jgi:hypothetical protein
MARTTGRGVALTFAVLVLLLGGLGALAAVTADRSVAVLAGGAPAAADAWRPRLQAMDAALARRDAGAAARAWHDAYAAALASRRWEAMLEVGDAAPRAGATGGGEEARARARQAYLLAFTRARQEGAVDGVLRAAQAFADLGDRDAATQCLRVAEQMRTMTF